MSFRSFSVSIRSFSVLFGVFSVLFGVFSVLFGVFRDPFGIFLVLFGSKQIDADMPVACQHLSNVVNPVLEYNAPNIVTTKI